MGDSRPQPSTSSSSTSAATPPLSDKKILPNVPLDNGPTMPNPFSGAPQPAAAAVGGGGGGGGGVLRTLEDAEEEQSYDNARYPFRAASRRQAQRESALLAETDEDGSVTGHIYIQDPEKQQLEKDTPASPKEKSKRSSIFKSKNKTEVKAEPTTPDEAGNAMDKLPEHERQILQRQLETVPVKTSYSTLFRYATRNDILIMILSASCAAIAGAAQPLMTVVFGSLSGTFQDITLSSASSAFSARLNHQVLYFVYIAIGEFVTIYISTVGFAYTGEHIARKIRERYLAAVLRQNIGYYDKLGAGEITTRITADTNLIQDGLSGKVGLTITALSTFITAFIIGFIKYWKLTLILSSSIAAIAVSMGIGSAWLVKWNKRSLDSYAVGGTVAEEVISSIRNATAFSTQDKLARQYDTYLVVAEKWGFKYKALLGAFIGILMWVVYMTYGLAIWQGSRFLVAGDGVSLSDILTILLSVIIGAFSLGNVAPNAQAFTTAAAAASKIVATIDRVSPMDPDSDKGLKLDQVVGTIELKNVRHIYPSRPEVLVMEDVSLFIPASKITALVGASGSGKSTIVGLVERFYNPVGGQILLDGVDITELNLRFLRQQISLVSQEPTLFGTTIFGNIAHGLIGTKYEHLADEKKAELIYEAAKMANAHDFISGLPEGYDTNVGERGFLLSGGQKQRIAIARAVVSDPKILLLDEATSALDTKSEGVVQAALDKAAEGRTTIMIAHRLSTIKNAHNIVVMSEGRIVEQGTHDQLLTKKAAYYNLVEAQRIAAAQKGNEQDEESEEVEETSVKLARTNSTQKLERATTSKSVSSNVLKQKPKEKEPDYGLWTLIKLIASFNKNEWHLMLFGLAFSIVNGLAQPVQSVFFAEAIVSLAKPPSQYAELRSEVNFWALMFLMLAFVILISYTLQGVAFAYCSERLVHRVRDRSFRTMLRQDIAWFDREQNSAGALTSFLSTETTQVAGLSGATLGTLLSVSSTLVGAFALSLAIGWKLALVCISTVPVVLACGYLRFIMLIRFAERAKAGYEGSAAYACEATSAIRTVASLTREGDVWENYHLQLVDQSNKSLKSMIRSAPLYAGSQSFMFLAIALGFWYGGTLISKGEYGLLQFFICISAVIFGAQSAGTIFSFAPDMGKAKSSAHQLKLLFDRQPEIDSWSTEGEMIETSKGAVEFRDVHFRYPTRPEQPILRGLSLSCKPGEYIALVGPSGCGKSTTIALLERFYNPLAGTITLDDKPIDSLNLNAYRSQIALVSQEPTLYQGTIKENILLGADHPDTVGDAEIEKACADANILNFIKSLPDGFNTSVGGKGVMLSGGQKQRVAIARALLRNPKVLLLDEATSALDSESEKVVQDALDKAAKGRSTIAVAHRLSTIQKADCIYVFEGGVVVEKGTHAELMSRKSRYRELVSLQSLEKMG